MVSAWCAKPANDFTDILFETYGDIVSTHERLARNVECCRLKDWCHSKKVVGSSPQGLKPLCVGFVCPPCVCVGSLKALQLLPIVQK